MVNEWGVLREAAKAEDEARLAVYTAKSEVDLLSAVKNGITERISQYVCDMSDEGCFTGEKAVNNSRNIYGDSLLAVERKLIEAQRYLSDCEEELAAADKRREELFNRMRQAQTSNF